MNSVVSRSAAQRFALPAARLAIASLRAVHRSGRWAAFWQTHPDRYQPPAEDALVPPHRRPPCPPERPVSPPVPTPRPSRPVLDRRPLNVRFSCPAPPRELSCGAPNV